MKKQNAYTLIELSIVIIIISLIVATIGAGNYLYGQYQLRAIINENAYYKGAIISFVSQYGMLPGDFNKASTLWPTCDGTPANCNGNADGVIILDNSLQYTDESIRAWQHLYLAGYIDQKMSGYHNVATENTIGTNVPASKFNGAGWYIVHINNACIYNSVYMVIGGNIGGTYNNNAIMTPMQAMSIDQKIDDGLPVTGRVFTTRTDAVAGCFGGYPVGQTCAISVSNVYNATSPYSRIVSCPLGFNYY